MCRLAADRSGPTRVAVLVVTRGAGAVGALLLRMRRLRPREVTNVAVATRGEMAGRDSNPDLRTWGFGGSVSAPELGVSSDASGEAGRQGRGRPRRRAARGSGRPRPSWGAALGRRSTRRKGALLGCVCARRGRGLACQGEDITRNT